MRFWNKKNLNGESNCCSGKDNTNRHYDSLTPKNNIENGQEYMAALDWALSESDVHNIAISGPYGSGKSSVIETYLKNRTRLKALRISLAAFNLDKMINGDGDVVDEKQLEEGILKQLFYSVDSRRIPQSRYRKIQLEAKWRNLLSGLLALFALCLVICFVTPHKTMKFIRNINALPLWGTAITYLVAFVTLWLALAKFVKWFKRNGNIQEVKILDKATLKNDKGNGESVFNKNMDEIVYFFEKTRTELVIIEDLDRFKSTNIFVALRELNNILNHYEKIKDRVKFVYAIKDDMFDEQGERTKFFDFIIPIVPYISSTNSEDMLRTELQFDNERNMSRIYDISGGFISLISPFISDMRELKCLCNEFNIFKNTLKENSKLNLIDEHMFALMVFKNLYPKEFAILEDEREESIVRKAFLNKKRFIEEQERDIETKKQNEVDKIRQMEKEVLQSVRELKLALLASLVDFQGAVYEIYDGTTCSISCILSDDFNVDVFKGKQITVYYKNGDRSNRKTIINIEDNVRDKGNYFARIERIKKGLVECKEESRCAIEKYEKKINGLRAYPVCKVIKEFGTDFLEKSVRNNNLLVFLLRHGYLDENYVNYINYFHPNRINKEEMNFILGVRNYHLEVDYSYPIKNMEQVFDKLQDFEFAQKEILNFDLADYVLREKLNTASAKVLIEQLSNHTEESMSFIKAYVERGKNVDKLISCLCKMNQSFWEDITDDNGISLETRYKYLALLLKYVDMSDIVAQNREVLIEVDEGEEREGRVNGVLTEFLVSHPDILKNINESPTDKQMELIEELGIEFINVEFDGVDGAIQEKVFDGCHYKLNSTMVQRLFEWKAPEQVDNLKYKNYTSILKLGYDPLIEYVHDYFANYITNIVLGIETNEYEETFALEDIIARLLPENEELCFKVLEKEKTIWGDIKCCCKGIDEDTIQFKKKVWDFLLSNGRIQCTWDNFIAYYEQYGSETCWEEYFDKNIDILLSDIDNPIITEEVLLELMFADITEESFRKYVLKGKLKPYEESLTKLNKMKIKVMIENGLLPYSSTFWDEMSDAAFGLRVLYAEANKDEFIASLDDIEMEEEEINSLLQSELFVPDEKREILSKLDVATLDIESAKVIKGLNFEIDRAYTDAAWNVLKSNDRYALLLNQIDSYENRELPDLFAELDPVYHQLVERTRHKFKFAYTDYNRKLLDRLVHKDYLTSVEEEWIDKEGDIVKGKKEHVITGYVKQLRA